MLFFATVMTTILSFSFLSQSVDSVGTIDVNIRQLVLRKTPPECCRSEVECMLLGLPSQPNRTSYDHCQLTFRLCISVPETRASECLILSRQFSLDVHMSKPLNWEDRTFSAVQLPSKSFNVTSVAIDSPNVSITLEVWNPGNDKLLLYSRNFVHISPGETTPKTLSTTSSQNSLIYQLSASCHAGYVGEGCALVCEPPNPSDHYHCDSQKGMVCDPGWSGPRCGLPICSLPCLNSASCAGPDECRCSKGWRGKQCEECIPKQGCRNGYCLSEPGKCICKPNWTGADCELRIDKCLDKPCQNGGKCTTNGLHGEAFHCSCREGFTGEDCSKLVSPCANSPCGLHGDCIPTGALSTDIYCRCHPGYWGSDCSNDRRIPKPLHILTTPTTPNRTNQSIETSTIPKATSQPPKPVPEEKVETSQIWVVNTLVGVCALLLLLILIALCAPMCTTRSNRCGFNCMHLKPEEDQKKNRTPKLYSLSQNFKGYEIDLAKDEEEVTSIRSSLIKNKPIIMEEAGDMVKEGVGRSGRVLLDISQTSSFCSRNRRRSAISLVHFSEQDEEEALELELRQNISGEVSRSSPRHTANQQQARRLTPLSTLLLLKSPPPPYSECSTQQDDSFSAEGAGSYAGVQPSTSTNLQSIDELDAEADQIDPKARSSTAIRSKDSPSTAVNPADIRNTDNHQHDSRSTAIRPQDSRSTVIKQGSPTAEINPEHNRPAITQPEESRTTIVQSARIIDLNQRPGVIHTISILNPFLSPTPSPNLRQISSPYDSLV